MSADSYNYAPHRQDPEIGRQAPAVRSGRADDGAQQDEVQDGVREIVTTAQGLPETDRASAPAQWAAARLKIEKAVSGPSSHVRTLPVPLMFNRRKG